MRISKVGTSNNGLTLLELLIVLFIVSVGLAVAFPSFTLQKDAELKSEAGRVAAIVRHLSDSAASTKEPLEMRLNFKEKRMRYQDPDGEKEEKVDYLRDITLLSGGRITDGEVRVLFTPTGPGENFTIHLTGPESSMAIIFDSLSGRVKVSEGEGI